ncbi:hypothetical protein RJ640_026064 [Escallonia rubra]|uniref:Uncharacterized protein n=1 Tax=Escallonia rubra TaxID=112253 RepID=A0AA88SNM4_9ASTE|nr:hypothetical protein RJ640_026064 [Escallonia rubra]
MATKNVIADLVKGEKLNGDNYDLRGLMIKFDEYSKDPKHTMNQNFRVMSNMIGKLKDLGHALTDKQQNMTVIRSLPASWANMKQLLTHSENIKNFSHASQHVILEAET